MDVNAVVTRECNNQTGVEEIHQMCVSNVSNKTTQLALAMHELQTRTQLCSAYNRLYSSHS